MNTSIEIRQTSTTLTPSESSDLARNESTIEHGLKNFIEVGSALLDINDRKLYRQTHPTFKDYVEEKWKMSVRRAYQLCETAETLKALPPSVQNFAQTESHVAELSRIPPEKRVEVLNRVETKAKATRKKATAKDIREAAATNTSELVDRPKFRAATKSKRNAGRWWWTKSTTPENRGQFLLNWIFCSDNPVVVPSKAELRQRIDRWMDDAVKEAKTL
jgi:DNA gyrase/topoisomerase IV subunit B